MNQPKITEQIGGYLIEWDNALSVIVKRLDVHSDGRVTGNIEIRNSSKENPIILLPETQFNFSAERTRSQTAKGLKDKFPDSDINFVELFDWLGYHVQDIARSGEPVQEIYATDDITPPAYLIRPLVIKGVSNIIFGEKGVNKSTLCYALGAIMGLPWPDNTLGLDVGAMPIKSLVLDWETDESIFKYYLSRLKRGMLKGDTFSLYYRKCRLPLVEEIEAIERYVHENNIEVLIIDSLAAAAGGERGELKGSESSLQFNAALRKIKTNAGDPITSLVIAQTSKDVESKKKSIYGSVLFTYYARNIFELCRGGDEDTDTLHLALFHRECNLGRKSSPMGFRLEFDDEKQTLTIDREPIDIGEFAQKVTTQSRILDALKRGAMSTKEIAESLEMKEASVRVIVNRLKIARKVVKVGEKWGLCIT